MTKITVIAAVVDTTELKLYKEDGSTIVIKQGDIRLKPILDNIVPILVREGKAEVDLSQVNEYGDFEKKTSGLVRFFRVAKNTVQRLFTDKVEPMSVGKVPTKNTAKNKIPVLDTNSNVLTGYANQVETARKEIDEIMAHGIPATDPRFSDQGTNKDDPHTVVAVVGNTVIPDAQKLKTQLQRSNQTNTKGMEAFMERISEVIGKRQHSIQDLMNFMERGDLPVADDGSIIIYKVLRYQPNREGYVDCHTGRVTQRVGSYVCMDEKLVDHNRHSECSNGLHVARRQYVKGFSGDVCVIAKVAPEDVIAVPYRDADKMRVCGYHILFELDQASFKLLKENKPFTSDSASQILLGRAIAGDHPAPMEEVRIHGQLGADVKITSLLDELHGTKVKEPVTVVATEAMSTEPEAGSKPAPPVDPTLVARTVDEQVSPPIGAALPLTRSEQARKLFVTMRNCRAKSAEEANAVNALFAFKKKAKIGWERLGFTTRETESILATMERHSK